MEQKEYVNMFRNEKQHFFYRANHKTILDFVQTHLAQKKRGTVVRILDAGCGTGLLAKKLGRFGRVVGVDINALAVSLAQKRGVMADRADIVRLAFRSNSFDCLVSIDVLYHRSVSSDKKALREFFRVLKPGAVAVIRVPAVKWLFSSHDVFVHTKKRYSKKELQGLLREAGFSTLKLSYMNASLLFPVLIRRLFEMLLSPKTPSSAIQSVPSVLNLFFLTLLTIERYVLRFTSLPFGIGLIAVCQKPSHHAR